MMRAVLTAALLCLAAPAIADAPPAATVSSTQSQVESILANAPKGARFGLLVVDDRGNVIASINPDQRFIPASTTKMFTTAAAYALLPGMDSKDAQSGAEVWLGPRQRKGPPDVVLLGNADARMSSTADCVSDCIATLADSVAAQTKVVSDVVGDDTRLPDQRWGPGMSWNNFGSNDATAASALTLDDNELSFEAAPTALGKPPKIRASEYVSVTNDAITVAGNITQLTLEHAPNSREFRLYGTLGIESAPWLERIGIDDPALYAAWTFARMLKARGVTVRGKVRSVHRPSHLPTEYVCSGVQGCAGQEFLGLDRLVPEPLSTDVVTINKLSQNLHAELILRRISHEDGEGSLERSLAAERELFELAGIPREGYDFFDGSGMSTYNRVSPRAGVALLRWIDTQPWGKAWYASLPIAGVDGTLKRRFIGTPLVNNLTAKTGTLNATNALSGTFRAASGKRLTFAFFANDVPDGQSAIAAMEAVLLKIAAAN